MGDSNTAPRQPGNGENLQTLSEKQVNTELTPNQRHALGELEKLISGVLDRMEAGSPTG